MIGYMLFYVRWKDSQQLDYALGWWFLFQKQPQQVIAFSPNVLYIVRLLGQGMVYFLLAY